MTPQDSLFPAICALCSAEGVPTRRELVEWREPVAREGRSPERWCLVPRCVDRAACRARVELELGESWPIDDATPAPAQPAPAPFQEPEPEEGVSPWLA